MVWQEVFDNGVKVRDGFLLHRILCNQGKKTTKNAKLQMSRQAKSLSTLVLLIYSKMKGEVMDTRHSDVMDAKFKMTNHLI